MTIYTIFFILAAFLPWIALYVIHRIANRRTK